MGLGACACMARSSELWVHGGACGMAAGGSPLPGDVQIHDLALVVLHGGWVPVRGRDGKGRARCSRRQQQQQQQVREADGVCALCRPPAWPSLLHSRNTTRSQSPKMKAGILLLLSQRSLPFFAAASAYFINTLQHLNRTHLLETEKMEAVPVRKGEESGIGLCVAAVLQTPGTWGGNTQEQSLVRQPSSPLQHI